MIHFSRFMLWPACLLLLVLCGGNLGQAQPPPIRWVYDAGWPIDGSPALGSDGAVYIGAGGNLYAVTNTGAVASNKWTVVGAGGGSPAISRDGTIYANGASAYLYAITPAGVAKWNCLIAGRGDSPAISPDGGICVGGDGFLYSVSPQGATNWQRAIGDAQYASPAIGQDGSVYAIWQSVLVLSAFDLAGNEKWERGFGTSGRLAGDSVGLGADGVVYVPGGDALCAFSSGGASLWSVPANFGPGSSVAVGPGGIVYSGGVRSFDLAGYGFTLAATSASGSTLWQVSTNLRGNYGVRLGTPAIDAAGTVCFGAYNQLFAFSPDGRVQWVFHAGGFANDPNWQTRTSPTIGADGTIYATFGSRLYAFAGTNGLADSPWPMYRQNARHTGKVEKPSLQRPQKRSDANFQFQLFGQISNTFSIETSTNLNTWTSLTSLVATTVPMDVVDLEATNFPERFYRAEEEPSAKRSAGCGE